MQLKCSNIFLINGYSSRKYLTNILWQPLYLSISIFYFFLCFPPYFLTRFGFLSVSSTFVCVCIEAVQVCKRSFKFLSSLEKSCFLCKPSSTVWHMNVTKIGFTHQLFYLLQLAEIIEILNHLFVKSIWIIGNICFILYRVIWNILTWKSIQHNYHY